MYKVDKGLERWNRYVVCSLVGGFFIMGLSGCAMAEGSGNKLRHGFSIAVGKNQPTVKNVRYLYGDLGWREIKVAAPPGALSTLVATMTIPDDFAISWDTQTGQHYDFKIPVRSKMPADIKGKTILFVIMQDHVEGFVVTDLPNFKESRERFY